MEKSETERWEVKSPEARGGRKEKRFLVDISFLLPWHNVLEMCGGDVCETCWMYRWIGHLEMARMVNFMLCLFYQPPQKKKIILECYGCMSLPGLPHQARMLWDNAWWEGGGWPGKFRTWGSGGWTHEVCHSLAKKLLWSGLKFCWREAARSCRPPRFEMLSRVCTHFLWLMRAGACLSWLQLDWRQALPWFGRKLLKLLPGHLLHLSWQQQASRETDSGLGSSESRASFSFSLVVL